MDLIVTKVQGFVEDLPMDPPRLLPFSCTPFTERVRGRTPYSMEAFEPLSEPHKFPKPHRYTPYPVRHVRIASAPAASAASARVANSSSTNAHSTSSNSGSAAPALVNSDLSEPRAMVKAPEEILTKVIYKKMAEDRFKAFKADVYKLVPQYLDMQLSFSDKDQKSSQGIIDLMLKSYPELKEFPGHWPILAFIQRKMKNATPAARKAGQQEAQKALRESIRALDSAGEKSRMVRR